MVSKNQISGTYSKLTLNNARLDVANFTISGETLTFNLYEGGNRSSYLVLGTRDYISVEAVLRNSRGERTFTGSAADINKIVIPLNNDLLEFFSLEEEINFRITVSIDDSRAFYQFNFTPNSFNSAYARMRTL